MPAQAQIDRALERIDTPEDLDVYLSICTGDYICPGCEYRLYDNTGSCTPCLRQWDMEYVKNHEINKAHNDK